MKKNFFKKLSFVMALAMIISTIAPAAGALAATSASLNSTKKYLYLGQDNMPGEFDFNIKNKPAGSAKFEWTSSNSDVATVESPSGLVTAQAKGTATIKVAIKSKAGKTLKTLSASVIVRDNIDTMKISNFTDKTVVNVGKEFDFDRTFTTFGGSTTATSAITRYAVDSDKATINATNGKFTANEAGEFNVTAYAFMSTYEYTKWLADKDAKWVLTSDTVKVVVAPSVVSTKQVDTDTVAITFDSDMTKSDVAAKAVLYQVVGSTEVSTGAEKIKETKIDGKVVTFDMYAPFSAGSDYKLVYGDLVATFTAAKTDLSEVKTVTFDDFNVDINSATGTEMLDSVKGYNAAGVQIKSGAELASNLTFTYGGDFTKGFVNSGAHKAFLYIEGYSATITVDYLNYVYDDTQKKYVEVKSTDSAVATAVKADTSLRATSVSYIVDQTFGDKTSSTTGWGSNFQVPANDGLFYIHSRYQNNTVTDGSYTYNDAFFTYTSNDPDKLLVNGATMVPVAQGTVTVLVKTASDGKVVGTFSVTIMPARTFVGATANVSNVTVGNSLVAGMAETKDIILTAKDSMNEVVTTSTTTFVAGSTVDDFDITNYPNGANTALLVFGVDATADDGTIKLSLNAAGATAGAYTVKVTVHALGATKDVYFTVIVLEANTPSTSGAVTWAPELSTSSVDLKDVTAANTITANVYGYNAAGARVAVLTHAQFEIAVKLNGNDVTTNVDNVADTIGVATSGAVFDLYATGTYVVTVTSVGANPTNRPNGAVIGYVQFTVADTTDKSWAIKASSVTKTATTLDTVGEAVQAAFEFKLLGSTINAASAGTWTYKTSDGSAASTVGDFTINAGTTLYVDTVTYTVGGKVYTYEIKKTISIR